jgi:hypothetical protein
MRIELLRSLVPALLLSAATLFAACGDSSTTAKSTAVSKPEPAKAPLIQKAQVADWCPEHGVPESACTRCNAKLIAQFQAKGDWCKEHSLPESQCIACHPELEAKLKAMAPKTGG